MKKTAAFLSFLVFVLCVTGCSIGLYSDDDIKEIEDAAYQEGYDDGEYYDDECDDDKDYYEDNYSDYDDFDSIYYWLNSDDRYNYVFITPTGHCYHSLDCETLANTEYVKAYTLGQAPEGYSECSVCRPWQYE